MNTENSDLISRKKVVEMLKECDPVDENGHVSKGEVQISVTIDYLIEKIQSMPGTRGS